MKKIEELMKERGWGNWDWLIPAILTAAILCFAVPSWDYYLINFNSPVFAARKPLHRRCKPAKRPSEARETAGLPFRVG